MEKLTAEDVKGYWDNGYHLYKKPLFTEEKFKKLHGIFEEHLANKGSKASDQLNTPHFHDERLLEFLLSDEILDLIEPIIGPNIVLWSSHFICKDPYTGRATPWHEDSSYWKGRLDKYDNIVTVWLALDRSYKDNGCMAVLPGSHNNGFSKYEEADRSKNTFGFKILDEDVDASKAVNFELEPGECSLHDSRIIHGAEPNTSPDRRCGYTMRYFSSDTKVNRETNPDFKIWLARGVDLAGNDYVNG